MYDLFIYSASYTYLKNKRHKLNFTWNVQYICSWRYAVVNLWPNHLQFSYYHSKCNYLALIILNTDIEDQRYACTKLKSEQLRYIPKLLEDANSEARSDVRSRHNMKRMVIPFSSVVMQS